MDQLHTKTQIDNSEQQIRRLAVNLVNTAIILVLVVVLMGGWTRINDAGLSCPDWPGCFGQLIVPSSEADLLQANKLYPQIAVEKGKSWLEMTHRYLAGSLGLLILALALISIRLRKEPDFPHILSFSLLLLVVFQAALGMWTVTMKLLPIIVTAHLFGGLLTTVLLLLFKYKLESNSNLFRHWKAVNYVFLWGLILLFIQIILGGWTSSNYAGWGCSDWLGCNPSLDIEYNYASAFTITFDTSYSHQGGNLPLEDRGAIQIIHRMGALAVFIYFLAALLLTTRSKQYWYLKLAAFVLVCLQIVLGFLNIIWSFPAVLAMGHHLLALALLVVSTSLLAKSFELQTAQDLN